MRHPHLRQLWLCLLLFVYVPSFAQTDSLLGPSLTFEGFLDLYYAYDFNQPDDATRLPWLVDHNRHNEINLNLGLLAARLDHRRYRANIALQAGTLVEDNYALESNIMAHVFDANIGVALNKKGSLWLDAGIFGESHVGLESGISIKNDVLSRSLVAELSPYYLTGLKLTYEHADHWSFSVNVNNGWQRIARVQGNSLPGFGTQVQYASDDWTLNWSTFICSEYPDETRRMRYFNDVFAVWQISEALRATIWFDFGLEQRAPDVDLYDTWWGGLAILRYSINKRWALASRGEYFHARREVVASVAPGMGLETGGFSLNADYLAFNRVLCRLEGRMFISPDEVFPRDSQEVRANGMLLLSMAVLFSKDVSLP